MSVRRLGRPDAWAWTRLACGFGHCVGNLTGGIGADAEVRQPKLRSGVGDAEHYRQMAAQMRVMARRAHNPLEIESYLDIARGWENLADEAERIDVSRGPVPAAPDEPRLC